VEFNASGNEGSLDRLERARLSLGLTAFQSPNRCDPDARSDGQIRDRHLRKNPGGHEKPR
jgi:hypothetical protein